VAQALDQVRQALERGQPYRVVLADFDFSSSASQQLVSELRGDTRLKQLHLALMTSVTARLENGWRSDSDRIVSLNKPVRLSQLQRMVDELTTGSFHGRHRVVSRPAPLPRFHGHVLLVEDNPINQAVAENMLQRVGVQVVLAADGRAAVDAVRDHRFDLVLMDVQMPVMDGLVATRTIRTAQALLGLHTPIVAITANAMTQEREQCVGAGMDDFLPKPFSSLQLYQVLARWLKASSAAAGRSAATSASGAMPLRPSPAAAEPVGSDLAQILDRAALHRIRDQGGRDRPELLANVVRLFLHDAPGHLTAIQQAWLRRDGQAMSTSAQVLKSASAHIGAMRLAAMCAALESDARGGQLSRAEAVVASLEGEWRAVRQELHGAMGTLVTAAE
jgi:CheY-like chemotaxis protein/HPt (histidine-containing phosphotransfer) domain-containing protein